MSEGLKALFAALADLGTQDIYTDAREYGGRTAAMHALCGLCRDALNTGRMPTVKKVNTALVWAEQDKELYHEGELE